MRRKLSALAEDTAAEVSTNAARDDDTDGAIDTDDATDDGDVDVPFVGVGVPTVNSEPKFGCPLCGW